MTNETWQALEKLFTRSPILRADPADLEEINEAERKVGVSLSDDYKEFIHRYGGAVVGARRIFGVRRAEPMAPRMWSLVDVTSHYRTKRWPGVDRWAVISMDPGGNPIGLDATGQVWTFDHDFGGGKVEVVAPDFEAFLKCCLADLAKNAAGGWRK